MLQWFDAMNLILMTESLENSQHLLKAAGKEGYQLTKMIGLKDDLYRFLQSKAIDIVFIVTDHFDQVLTHKMLWVAEHAPVPVVLFSKQLTPELIKSALEVGVSECASLELSEQSIGDVLRMATIRHKSHQKIVKELVATKKALVERKSVERAKGILMRMKSVNEDQAYRALRKLAMDKNKRMGEIAEQVIAASEVLV